MKTTIKKQIAVFTLVTAALIAAPIGIHAADANTKSDQASESGTAAANKQRHLPFHGKAAAVDTKVNTLTVGHMVIHVTSETKITKNGKPAKLSDITVGEKVSGAYVKDDNGQMNASVIHIGPKGKADGKENSKKAEKADKD